MVIWLIGKSGAGKTSIGEALKRRIATRRPGTVFLDGDILRDAVCEDLGYSVPDRYVSERRSSRLSKLLADQGVPVICAKLSNAPDIRQWNRRNISGYREIYIKVPEDILESEDRKGLYRAFRNGETENVVGMDIPFHEPLAPWMTIHNDRTQPIQNLAERIMERIDAESQDAAQRESIPA